MSALDRVLDQVERTKQVGNGDYLSSCPVDGHGRGRGDQNPSLHVTWDGEKVLLHCAGGCHPQDVLIAMGMDWPDLWDEPVTNHRGQLAASWTYTQRDGTPYFVVERWQGPQGKFFRQRLPEATTAGLGSGFKPCLLNMPKVFDAIHHGEEVWVVEGEKCVSAAERLGLVATTAPMGINGWKDYYAKWFTEGEGAKCVNVVVDNDEAGHRYGAAVAVCLRGVGIKVKTWRVATTGEKDDLYDHVLAGLGVADLVPIRLNRLRPEGLTLRQLMTNKYPAIKWAIDGILPAGLALLGGPPKSSKSMIALEMSLGIAHGQAALSRLRCNLGSVLYLSLDNDAARRLQSRVRYLMPMGLDIETPIEFHTEWPTGDAAIQGCQEWLDDEREEGRNPLLVVVDTLGKAEPNFEGNGFENSYLASTATLSRWSKFATDNDVAVLAVHHDRKSGDEDWLNRFTGSRGITATAQTLMMLESKRGEETGFLRIAGRDIETDDLELRRSGWSWIAMDEPTTGLHVVH